MKCSITIAASSVCKHKILTDRLNKIPLLTVWCSINFYFCSKQTMNVFFHCTFAWICVDLHLYKFIYNFYTPHIHLYTPYIQLYKSYIHLHIPSIHVLFTYVRPYVTFYTPIYNWYTRIFTFYTRYIYLWPSIYNLYTPYLHL